MRSPLVLGVSLALVIALACAAFWLIKAPKSSDTPVILPPADPRESGATILLPTRSGEVVSVPDFTYGHPRVDIEDTNVTLVLVSQSLEGVEKDPVYGIVFSSDSEFTIGLFAPPLGSSRLRAEAHLRQLMALPDDILCALPITVAVPATIQPMYAEKNVGLSFCPGSVDLP